MKHWFEISSNHNLNNQPLLQLPKFDRSNHDRSNHDPDNPPLAWQRNSTTLHNLPMLRCNTKTSPQTITTLHQHMTFF
jgi:hypothetical protein